MRSLRLIDIDGDLLAVLDEDDVANLLVGNVDSFLIGALEDWLEES